MEQGLTKRYSHTLALALLAFAAGTTHAETVTLFQPGQSAWEWLLVPSKHDGGKRMRENKDCLFCHAGEEQVIGNAIVAGHAVEPEPIAGMAGYVEMTIEASYDDENLYLSACWTAPTSTSPWGDEDAEQMLTFALGTEAVNVVPIAGCWAACHTDLPGMPDAADPPLTKYLPGSRNKMTATGGGSDIRAPADLAVQLAEGKYMEYWQLELQNGSVTAAGDGYFLERRTANADPAVSGSGSAGGPGCSLQLVRPLTPGGDARHALQEGKDYTVGVALHANHASGRHHYTSFPLTFRLGGGEAELVARKR